MKDSPKQKIVVVIGPTASGKTSLAVHIAQTFDGEVISADSRQVYQGLDIGTEKITTEEMGGVPHHLIDCVDPLESYTAFDFKKDAEQCIAEIAQRNHAPVIAGGTLFYIETLLGRKNSPEIAPNPDLRAVLEKLPAETLFEMLKTKDLRRAQAIDSKNPRRLVRALEIVDALGVVPEEVDSECPYEIFIVGISVPVEILKERIAKRLRETLQKGLVAETQMLLKKGISEERLSEIGLEYRVVLSYLRGEIEEEDLAQKLIDKVWQYAKRQRTWLKRVEGTHWYDAGEKEQIVEDVRKFLER